MIGPLHPGTAAHGVPVDAVIGRADPEQPAHGDRVDGGGEARVHRHERYDSVTRTMPHTHGDHEGVQVNPAARTRA